MQKARTIHFHDDPCLIYGAGADQARSIYHRCIVCGLLSAELFVNVDSYSYRRCSVCQATFLNPTQRMSTEEEFEHYRNHRNDPADKNYRRFLSKLADPLLQRLSPHAKGLDYGCGSGPALACMLGEAGHRVGVFDPLFFPDPEPLDDLYDFITCTETIEHFHRPADEFARFDRMLRPGGWLALMTCFQTDDDYFGSWYYRRDPTHVVFYSEVTLRHIAHRFGWTCEIPLKDVALMHKPDKVCQGKSFLAEIRCKSGLIGGLYIFENQRFTCEMWYIVKTS